MRKGDVKPRTNFGQPSKQFAKLTINTFVHVIVNSNKLSLQLTQTGCYMYWEQLRISNDKLYG